MCLWLRANASPNSISTKNTILLNVCLLAIIFDVCFNS